MYALSSLYGGRHAWVPSGALSASDLRVYQVALGVLGFGPNTVAFVDGLPGPVTSAAVRAFQVDRRLPATGQFDAATLAALDNDVAMLERAGRPVHATAVAAAAQNAATAHTMLATSQPRPASRPAAVGTHPKVNTIATPTGTVVVPEKVSTMMPAATIEQLKTMPAAQVQSFVNDLASKADTAAETSGIGKDVAVTAVPIVGPNGAVTAAISTAPAGWWDSLSDTQKAGVAAGGTLLVIGAGAALWSIASAPKGK